MVTKKAVKTEEAPEVVEEYVPVPPPPKDELTKANRRYWDVLKDVTDTTALKGFTKGGGFTGTDINPTWRMERLTEVFGPIGWGWGYEVTNRRTEVLKAKKGDAQVVFVTVRCWYVPVGEEPAWPKVDGITDRRNPPLNALWTGEQDGGTEVSLAPDEVYKQAITDGFGKTSAQVGLASAIYRGKWDDSKYKEDQERFSQIQEVHRYLEVLAPELEAMDDTRELRGLYKRASFIANKRVAHEASFKTGNEFDAVIKEHENRIVHVLWGKVREALKVDDLEVLSAEIAALGPQITALPDERDVAEMRTLVATRKAELKKAKEPVEVPKTEEQEPTGDDEGPELPTPNETPGSSLPHISVARTPEKTYWGKFTNEMIRVIHQARDTKVYSSELTGFIMAHHHLLEEMRVPFPNYSDKVMAEYDTVKIYLEGLTSND